MKRVWRTGFAIVLAGVLLTGCGGGTGNSTDSTENNGDGAANSGETKELDFLWFADGNETEVMQSLIDEYEAENPEIKINLQEVPFEDMSNKIMMSVSGGEAPALARTTDGIVAQVSEACVDFRDYVEDSDELLSQFMDSIQYQYVVDGKICGLPTEVTANGMIYNKTAFEQAGVEVPSGPDDIWTWEEFTEALTTVVNNSDVKYGMVIDNPTHRWCTMLYEFGGSLITEDGGNLSSPESLACIEFTKKLHDDGLVPQSVWLGGEDPNNMFRSGQVACHLSGTWMMQNYNENIKDFEWGVTYMPIEKTRSSVPGGKNLTAYEGSGYEQEAVDFILWVTAKEQNEKYCVDSLFVSPRLDNANIEYPFGSEYFAIFSDELNHTVDAAAFDWSHADVIAEIGTTLTDDWSAVISGQMTPEEMAAEIDELSNGVMKK